MHKNVLAAAFRRYESVAFGLIEKLDSAILAHAGNAPCPVSSTAPPRNVDFRLQGRHSSSKRRERQVRTHDPCAVVSLHRVRMLCPTGSALLQSGAGLWLKVGFSARLFWQ